MIEVTCALIHKDHNILVAQNRSTSDHPFQWEFPGGKIRKDETPESCIIREIEEELSLRVSVVERMQSIEYDYGNKVIRLIPFLCRIEAGEVKLNDHAAAKWLGLDDLPKLDLAAADRVLLENKQNKLDLEEYLRKQMNDAR